MKKLILFFAVLATSVVAISLSSCSSDANNIQEENALVVTANTRSVDITTVNYCGEETVVKLLAGQNIDVGTVTVGNDAEFLYVTYKVTGDWRMKKLDLFAGACDKLPVNKSGNLVPGQFPYHAPFDVLQTEYTFAISLADLPECMCIAAHADVVKVNAMGEIIQSETAFGEGTPVGKNWFMKFEYCKQTCVDEEVCYQKETAWAFGPRYVQQGNWATYTPYFKDDVLWGEVNSPVIIYAGQNMEAGTVEFTPYDSEGNVTITIKLTNGWELADVDEPVKIQGYDPAPSGNPSPGLFVYKGTSLTWNVGLCRYYGIHLDVRKQIECE